MKNPKTYDIIILGAGAAGLMCASKLPKHLSILLIDQNPNLGAKIKISGGGNCNISNENIAYEDFLGDREFLKPILERFTCKDILDFFDGVEFEKRKQNQYFCKYGSKQVIEFFRKTTAHCDFKLSTKCLHVSKSGKLFTCKCDKATFESKYFIVASGGLSYPKLGASSIGYDIATSFGHSISTLNPALVGFTVQKEEFWVKKLSGISLHVKVKVGEKEFFDDLLFSHKGFSGPAFLNASLFWKKGKISIDFMPKVSLKSCIKNQTKKQISSLLPLPKRFIKAFLEQVGMEDKAINRLTKEELQTLETIHNYTFSPAGTFGYTKAEVTRGGVKTEEINSQTYESKKLKNLFFIGEVLDITGRLGGYNFYFAFTSAMMLAYSFTCKEKHYL